jgi:superfamily II DNA or RNA helicase
MLILAGRMAVPEEGQLVSVRDRHWIVKGVQPSSLPPDVMSRSDTPQHLVELSSVEDDGLGEELTVIWQIEPAVRILETANLPVPIADRFDEPGRLSTFLDAVRWGAIASADSESLQSPFRSGITIEEYQLDPVVRALSMARVNLLIADDVGLGKTIEAGLIAQELILRHRVRTVLILCPPSLCIKWQAEMRDKFGLEFRIVDSEAIRRLRRDRGVKANIFAHFPRLIISFDWLKMERPMRILREYLPADRNAYPRKIDLLIVDEAHQCAPAGSGKYATDSQRTTLLREVGPYAEHRLFLSATPHNGYENSYSALLELLDPQRFARGVRPDPSALQHAVIRRMKDDIRDELGPDENGNARFPKRVIEKIEVEYPAQEAEVHQCLAEYAESRRKETNVKRKFGAADLITLLLKKRLFSSPAAFAITLDAHLKTLAEAAQGDAGEIDLREAYAQVDFDFEDDEDLEEATLEAFRKAAKASSRTTPSQVVLLEKMRTWAQSSKNRPDEKARALITKLKAWCHGEALDGKPAWTDERVIIFTEYRDTQVWLQRLLVAEGLGGERLALLHGSMDPNDREHIKAAFQYDPSLDPVRILLATDTASEGIDLQLHCNRMIHVEIPFNPNRLEQRNGRIDRHGQPKSEVFIYHFVGKDYASGGRSLDADLDFLYRAALKLEHIRRDLGRAGSVLAREVENAMLGRDADLEKATILRSGNATVLRAERALRDRVREIREKLNASIEELGLSPEAIHRVVEVGLELGRQSPLKPIELKPRKRGAPAPKVFEVPELTRSWAAATTNLYHPLTGARLPISFDNKVADGREDVVLGHLGSRLVTQAMRLLRAEIWTPVSEAYLTRFTGRLVHDADLAEPIVVIDSRFVVMGIDGYRLHEQIFPAGGRLGGRSGFARLGVGDIKAALQARGDTPLPRHHRDEIEQAWNRLSMPVFEAVQARAEELRGGVKRRLEQRRGSEVEGIRTVLGQLASSIRKELDAAKDGKAEQLTFFDLDDRERNQLRRDIAALEHRLNEIPEELEREIARLQRRYSDARDVVFPAAATVLVPRRFAHGSLGILATARA